MAPSNKTPEPEVDPLADVTTEAQGVYPPRCDVEAPNCRITYTYLGENRQLLVQAPSEEGYRLAAGIQAAVDAGTEPNEWLMEQDLTPPEGPIEVAGPADGGE